MKKRITLISLLALALGMCLIVGFVEESGEVLTTDELKNVENEISEETETEKSTAVSTTDESTVITNQSASESVNKSVEESKTVESGNVSTIEKIENIKEFKSDAEVMAEISKYVNTDIEFKLNRQEKINKKQFELTFLGMDDNHEKAIYTNESEDVFKYDAKDGKLREAIINSLVTQKTDKSIDKTAAQGISVEYANSRYETDVYKMHSYKETTKGHSLIYTRYIGGYPSTDKFSVKVGYDGNIVYTNDFTDTFAGKNLNFDKAFIDAKIKEYSDESKVDWESVTICMYEGKVAVSYTIPEQCVEAILPLE